MGIENLASLADYAPLWEQMVVQDLVFAFAAIIAGVIAAKLAGRAIQTFGRALNLVEEGRALRSLARLFELFVVIISIIIALNFLHVNAAQVIMESLLGLIPNIVILLLLLFLGAIIITLVVDITRGTLLKIGFSEYLDSAGIPPGFVNNSFAAVKIFLFVILFSVSFSFVGISVPFVESILVAFIYGVVLLCIALIYYVFKDQLANFFAGVYIERNLLKPGQQILLDKECGEVIGVTLHGTLIRLSTGYNLLIPNKDLVKERLYLRRTKQDINRLEAIRSRFVAQLPAFCGPASASIMLLFFGYDIPQEELGKLSQTRTPGGTGPRRLVEGVKAATHGAVKGVLVRYDDISNLRDEIKTWLGEGALLILWFNKTTLFRTTSGRGHYVLCVGVEDDELIIMDPSKTTAGVYFIDYTLFEEAMSEIDRKRGYIVFAKKGTPAYWRISEGLVYSDLDAYTDLSKSFERYLRKAIRRNSAIHQILSEHVFRVLEKEDSAVKMVWKPLRKKKKKKSAGSKAEGAKE